MPKSACIAEISIKVIGGYFLLLTRYNDKATNDEIQHIAPCIGIFTSFFTDRVSPEWIMSVTHTHTTAVSLNTGYTRVPFNQRHNTHKQDSQTQFLLLWPWPWRYELHLAIPTPSATALLQHGIQFLLSLTRNSSGDEIANMNFLCDNIVHALKIQ